MRSLFVRARRPWLQLALVLGLVAPGAARADLFLGQRRTAGEAAPPQTDAEEPAARQLPPHAVALLERIRDEQQISLREFLFYVRLVEDDPGNQAVIARSRAATADADLPAQGWALVITKMHDQHYHADRLVTFGPVRLFRNGTENQGWEDIDLLVPKCPKFVYDSDGSKIDIAHAYAGVASLVMRKNGAWNAVTRQANTDLGDRLQVANGWISGAGTWVKGILDGERRAEGAAQIRNAGDFRPPDQQHGNKIGLEANKYLKKDRDETLARALLHGAFEFWVDRSE